MNENLRESVPIQTRRFSFDLSGRRFTGLREDLDKVPAVPDEWRNLTKYRKHKQRISAEYERLSAWRIRAVFAVLFAFLILVFTQDKRLNNTRVSAPSLELFWYKMLMDGKTELSFASNEKLMDQLYDNLHKIYYLDDQLFGNVKLDEIKVSVRYLNIDQDDRRMAYLPQRRDFSKENITDVLDLPMDLNDAGQFKIFFDRFDTVTLIIEGVNICYFKEAIKGCYNNKLKIRYIRFGYRFYGKLTTLIMRQNGDVLVDSERVRRREKSGLKMEFGQMKEQKRLLRRKAVGDLKLAQRLEEQAIMNSKVRPLATEKAVLKGNLGAYQADHSQQNRLVALLLMTFAVWGLYLDLMKAYYIKLDHRLEKHFELNLIIIGQEKVLRERLGDFKPKRIGKALVFSTIKNGLLTYYCLTHLFPRYVKIVSGISDITEFLVFFSAVELLILHKNIGLLLSIMRKSIALFLGSFSGFVAMACAIVFVGHLLISSSDYFHSVWRSLYTFLCLMVGDSIVPIFDSVKAYSWFVTSFLASALLFFVFCLQSLYIMIITDTFMSEIDSERAQPAEGAEVPEVAGKATEQSPIGTSIPLGIFRQDSSPQPNHLRLDEITEEKIDHFDLEDEHEYFAQRPTNFAEAHKNDCNGLEPSLNKLPSEEVITEHKNTERNDNTGDANGNAENLPNNDNSSVYADSREESPKNNGSPRIRRLDTSQQLLLRREAKTKSFSTAAQRMFTQEQDDVRLFNKTYQDLQAQFKAMNQLEMDIFGKIKKLVNVSLKIMTNFERMYVKLCIEFVQGNITKQKAKVVAMRKTI